MAQLLLYVQWSVASLLLAGIIISADDQHPGAYNEHVDRHHYGSIQIDDWNDNIDKHNNGYVLKCIKDVHIATYHAKMIFHLQLPDWQVEFYDIDHDCESDPNTTIDCLRLRDMLNAIRHIPDNTQVFIQHQVRRIHEVIMNLLLHTGVRSCRGFMAYVLSHMTWLAIRDQVHAVVHVFRQVEAGIYESARLWGDGARSLTTAFRIQQD